MAKNRQYLALLRGINVGGKNVISKDDLRECFEQLGFAKVTTYIQSGNVLFRSQTTGVKELTSAIEAALSARFCYAARAVVLTRSKYESAVRGAPTDWGADDTRRHNALFTLRGLTAKKVMSQLELPDTDIETVTSTSGAIFWSASKEHVTKTTMIKLSKSPLYQQLTVRNHNTVFKLLDMLASE